MDPEDKGVTITNIDMPFRAMVRFMVKSSIAAIPALLILVLIASAISQIVTGIFGMLSGSG
jgi:hypothetical protein